MQLISHAVTKSFCFYAAGAVLLIVGTRDIAKVHGLIRRAPVAGAALFLGGLAIAGAPPFALFLSEFSVLKTGLLQGEYWAVGFLVFFIGIAFFAIMNHVSRMVFGAVDSDTPLSTVRLPVSCTITLVLAAVPVILLGIYIPGSLH